MWLPYLYLDASITAIIVTALGISVPFLVWLMLNLSRNLITDTGYECKCRRINLFDPSAYKLEISFLNLGEKEKQFSNILLLYKDKDGMHEFAKLTAPAFSYSSNNGKLVDDSKIILGDNGSISLIYAFNKLDSLPEDLPLYLCYDDPKGKKHFASFEKEAYYSQLLTFKRRNWKIV